MEALGLLLYGRFVDHKVSTRFLVEGESGSELLLERLGGQRTETLKKWSKLWDRCLCAFGHQLPMHFEVYGLCSSVKHRHHAFGTYTSSACSEYTPSLCRIEASVSAR